MDGKALRKQVEVSVFKNGKTIIFNILLYLPKIGKPSPIFLGFNFYGNHTVTNDTNIIVSDAWAMNNEEFGIIDHTLTEASRGIRAHRWAIKKMVLPRI